MDYKLKETYLKVFKTKLEEIMKKEGRTQTWLAKQISADVSQVNRWTKGIHEPSDRYKIKIARVLGRSVEEIFFVLSVNQKDVS